MAQEPSAATGDPRILIARLSAIGDAIHTMPVLCALRRQLPQALLAWVVEERAAALLRGHEALDELITLPRGWLKSPKTVWRLRQRLRAFAPHVTIDPQGLTKSALVARLSGAGCRIGFGDEKGRELSRWLNTDLVSTTAPHVVDCYLALLEPLGIDPEPVEFRVPENEADRATAARIVWQAGLENGFAVINPGAGWPSRVWPAVRHGRVADYLGRQRGLSSLVVWAGGEERSMAERIAAGSGGHARPAPATTLTELAALLRLARLFIGSDTGPLHLAAAVGTPCISLHGTTWAGRSGPYGPKHIALQKMSLDHPLDRARKTASNRLMEAISVELVCEACDRILRRDASHAA